MITIPGTLIRGHGVASGQGASPYPRGTIAMQKPFFLAFGLDLSPYVEATLNISIAPRTFTMLHPEITFPHVEWTDLHPPETFSFSRCRVTFKGAAVDAWVYYPHPETKIRHFQSGTMIEVIAPRIDSITYGDPIDLTVNPAEIEIHGPI